MNPSRGRALLAIDLGLMTGLALFDEQGRLVWYRSQHFATRESLRRGARGLFRQLPEVGRLAMEGGGPIGDIWAREAERLGIAVTRVAAETWRADCFPDGGRLDRAQAKKAADKLARALIERDDAPRPTSLRHDAAEAILLGYWAVSRPPDSSGST